MRTKFTAKALGVLTAIGALCAMSPAANATSGENTILDITIETGTNYARVALNGGAIGGRPACHNASYTVHYGFDISTAKGKALLSTAQAALLAGKIVTITGGTTCTNTGSVTLETMQKLTIWP